MSSITSRSSSELVRMGTGMKSKSRWIEVGLIPIVVVIIGAIIGPIIVQMVRDRGSDGVTSTASDHDLSAKIVDPKPGDKIPVSYVARGSVYGVAKEEECLWVMINPIPNPGQWWPQGKIDSPEDWNMQIWLGRQNEDIGYQFIIAVVKVGEKDDKDFRDYLVAGQRTGVYPGLPLPQDSKIADEVTVIRK